MASYPGSVFSPATINNGETVDASHQNQPNDEINAIETALVNGEIAHDVSPSSSAERSLGSATKRWSSLYVDAIQSTGNSSLGNLTVANLQVTGGSSGIVVAANEHARVYRSAHYGPSTLEAIPFDQQQYVSTSTWHSTTTNPSRLKVPSSGIYAISAHLQLEISAVSSASYHAQFLVDSTTIIYEQEGQLAVPGGGTTQSNDFDMNTMYRFANSTSFCELRVRSTQGSSLTVRVVSDYTPTFSMTKL